MKKGVKIAIITLFGLLLALLLAVAGFLLWLEKARPAITHDQYAP